MLPLRKEIRVGTSKIISSVPDSCIFSSLTEERIVNLEGSGISSAVAKQGPTGQKVSKVLPLQNWPPPFFLPITSTYIIGTDIAQHIG